MNIPSYIDTGLYIVNIILVLFTIKEVYKRRAAFVLFLISFLFYFKCYITNSFFIIATIVATILAGPFIYVFSLNENFFGFTVFFIGAYFSVVAEVGIDIIFISDRYKKYIESKS